MAGDPESPRWVAGYAGGHPQMRSAERAALRECARRRAARRLQVACRIYARGDERVRKAR